MLAKKGQRAAGSKRGRGGIEAFPLIATETVVRFVEVDGDFRMSHADLFDFILRNVFVL